MIFFGLRTFLLRQPAAEQRQTRFLRGFLSSASASSATRLIPVTAATPAKARPRSKLARGREVVASRLMRLSNLEPSIAVSLLSSTLNARGGHSDHRIDHTDASTIAVSRRPAWMTPL